MSNSSSISAIKPAPAKSDGIKKKKTSQPSRKGKKNWRKNVDITEIEQGLEELRDEDMTGGRVHEKDDSELFKIDKSGDEKVKKSLKNRRLKIDEILTPQSALPGIQSRKRASSTKTIETPYAVKKVSKTQMKILNEKAAQELKRNGVVDLKEIQKKKKEEEAKKIFEKKKKKAGNAFEDIWDLSNKETEKVDEYLEPAMKKPIKKPILKAHKVEVPAVNPGHPGTSYNPTFTSHQGVLKLALDEELTKIEQRKQVEKKLSYPKILDELPEDDVDGDEDDEQEVEPTQEENLGQDGLLHINEPVNPDKRKTTAQRNREAKIKKQLAMEEKQREQKKLRKELNRIAELKKEIEKDPKKSETEEKKDDGDVLPPPKRLGPHVFKKPAMTIQLTDELSDSLRRLKPEGSIIKDRFTSLQERAMIEPRVPVKRKLKYNRKMVESHDYKRFK